MNYTELTNAIKEYTDNTETTFVNNIPNLSGKRKKNIPIYSYPRTQKKRNNIPLHNRFLAKPTDF